MGQESPSKICRKFRFTVRRIEELPTPPRGTYADEWSDTECVGLRVMSSPTGRRHFHFRYSYSGRKKSISIGEFPAVSVQEARSRVLFFKNALARGIDPREEIQRQKKTPTLKEFCAQEFIPNITARKKSFKQEAQKLEKTIYPELGDRPISAITKGDVIRCVQRIENRSSGATANRYLALLSGLFNYAVDLEILKKNPAKGVERYHESSGNERFLSDAEITKFLVALEKSRSRQAALAIQLLLATGMRKSEALTLPWHCVDLERVSLKLEMQVTKGNRARMVVLNEAAIKILEELKSYRVAGNPYVFPGCKPGGHLIDLRKTFLTAIKRAGIAACRIHDLRHTFCAKLASSGVSLIIIASLAGHRCLRTTERYSHLNDKCLREASSIMGRHINSASGCEMLQEVQS